MTWALAKQNLHGGFLSYFGLEQEISSPTFTIVNEYETSTNTIYHFDVYRLNSIDEFYAIGGDEYFDNGICIVEWGELITDALPPNYIHITFERDLEHENKRILHINIVGQISSEIIHTIENACNKSKLL